MLNDERIGVSIVCLSYNNEKYIGQMLDSLICQRTTFNYEILIHDDASTDNTQQIIGRYAKAYPKLIKPILQTENQYSKGVSPNMTFNYPRVKGKYVAFCEGDDYWANPNKLQSQFEIMETNPKCSICVHETQCVSPDGEPIRQKFPPINVNRRIIEKRRYLEYELKRGLWMFQTIPSIEGTIAKIKTAPAFAAHAACKNRHPSPICTQFEHHPAGVSAPLSRTEAPKPYNWFSAAKL